MLVWSPKDPAETVAYVDDWSDELGTDTIVTYTFVPTGTATVAKIEQTPQSLKYWIAGGTDGATTSFAVSVTTATGQVLNRTFTLMTVAGANSFQPTSTTKRQLVEQMFTEVALNGWEYDLTADEKNVALTRLDAMMWEFMGRGLDLSYNFPVGIGQGDLDDDLGCPDQAFFGLAVQGALRLCPTMGKNISAESRAVLNDAMKAVRNAANNGIKQMGFARGTATGSGNKPWGTRYPFASVQ